MKRSEMTAEQKRKANAQNAASRARYEAKAYKKVTFRLPKDPDGGCSLLNQIERAAEQDGLSVNAWIIETIRGKL